jgi:hypothetical protein
MVAMFAMAVAAMACGHKQPTGGGGVGSASGSGTGTGTGTGTGSGSETGSGTDQPADAPVTREECVAVLGHIVDIGMADQRKRLPPDQAPTDEDVAKARKRTIDGGLEECLKMPRTMYACAMKAQDAAAMKACDQQP